MRRRVAGGCLPALAGIIGGLATLLVAGLMALSAAFGECDGCSGASLFMVLSSLGIVTLGLGAGAAFGPRAELWRVRQLTILNMWMLLAAFLVPAAVVGGDSLGVLLVIVAVAMIVPVTALVVAWRAWSASES